MAGAGRCPLPRLAGDCQRPASGGGGVWGLFSGGVCACGGAGGGDGVSAVGVCGRPLALVGGAVGVGWRAVKVVFFAKRLSKLIARSSIYLRFDDV